LLATITAPSRIVSSQVIPAIAHKLHVMCIQHPHVTCLFLYQCLLKEKKSLRFSAIIPGAS